MKFSEYSVVSHIVARVQGATGVFELHVLTELACSFGKKIVGWEIHDSTMYLLMKDSFSLTLVLSEAFLNDVVCSLLS